MKEGQANKTKKQPLVNDVSESTIEAQAEAQAGLLLQDNGHAELLIGWGLCRHLCTGLSRCPTVCMHTDAIVPAGRRMPQTNGVSRAFHAAVGQSFIGDALAPRTRHACRRLATFCLMAETCAEVLLWEAPGGLGCGTATFCNFPTSQWDWTLPDRNPPRPPLPPARKHSSH